MQSLGELPGDEAIHLIVAKKNYILQIATCSIDSKKTWIGLP